MSLSVDRGRQSCFVEEIIRQYFHHKINLQLQVHLTVSRHREKHIPFGADDCCGSSEASN
jgi:hypothetical protein